MCGDPFDEIQCEDYYGDEPEPIDDGFDSLTIRQDELVADGWLNADGTTGPTGLDHLASQKPEDFV